MNKLDQSIKLLTDHKRGLEQEAREIARAITRIDRAITALGVQPGKVDHKHPNYKGPLGPIRHDSHVIMRDAIKTAFAEGHVFTRRQARELVSPDILRVGQANGAIDTLHRQRWLHHGVKHGTYYHGKREE